MKLYFEQPQRPWFLRIFDAVGAFFDACALLEIIGYIVWAIVGLFRIALFLLRLIFV